MFTVCGMQGNIYSNIDIGGISRTRISSGMVENTIDVFIFMFDSIHSFLCSKCRMKLRNQIFYMKNDVLYCSKCINELEPCLITLPSSPNLTDQCKKCGKHFLAGQPLCMYQYDVYHSHCLRCGNCAKILLNEGFFRQEDGCFYCLNCHIEHGPHCLICKEAFLTGEILSQFDGKQFHSSCFLCDHCQQIIEMKSFCYQNGQIICENCWQE